MNQRSVLLPQRNNRLLFFLVLILTLAVAEPSLSEQQALDASSGTEKLDARNRQLFERALSARDAGKQDSALNLYLKILETHPDSPAVLREAGDILFGQGKYADAAGVYLRLLRQRPDDGNIMLRLGVIRQRLGQLYEAQTTLFRALNASGITDENSALARKALGEIYDNWDVLTVMQKHNDNPAQERFHTWQIEKDPNRAAVSYALRGLVRQTLHRPDEALRDFDRALNVEGMNDDLKNVVLNAKSGIEQARAAEQFWQDIHRKVAELKDSPSELETYYTGLLDKEEARVFAAVSRAFVRLSRNDFDGAESDLHLALRSNPDEKARTDIMSGLRQVEEERLKANRGSTTVARPGSEKSQASSNAATSAPTPAPSAPAPASNVNPYEYFDQADRSIQQGQYRQAEAVLGKLRRLSLNNEEKGIMLYYRAELDLAEGNREKAYQGYKKAARLVREKYRKSSIYYRMAEYHAKQGKPDQAAAFAERSAAALPDEDWKLVQIGSFFNGLGRPDTARSYFEKALRLHPEPRTSANAVMGLADVYKARNDQEGYARYARLYIDTVGENPALFSDEEKGTADSLQAELLETRGDRAGAFAFHEKASRQLSEKYRLSETYIKMAEYQADLKNAPLAAKYAEASAALLPSEIWRVQSVAGVFRRTGNIGKADQYLQQAIDLNPAENGYLYREIAGMYGSAGDSKAFLLGNASYIDYLRDKMARQGRKPSREEILELHNARVSQKNFSRTWGFSSYSYYSRSNESNYFYGMTNELSYELRLPGGISGKIYGQYVGTLTSYFSGDYLDKTTKTRNSWQSRTNWNDSAHGVLGFQIHPFPALYDLSFDAEYVFPLHDGKHKSDDFRIRASYGWTEGDEPRPFDNAWNYIKLHTSGTYSFRDGDVTSDYSFNGGDISAGSEFRYGKTLVMDFDRNFLIIPFAQAKASYLGRTRKPDERWQVQAGPSIMLKKWFNETDHRAPMSSLEVQFYYNWELTNKHENWFGINTGITF